MTASEHKSFDLLKQLSTPPKKGEVAASVIAFCFKVDKDGVVHIIEMVDGMCSDLRPFNAIYGYDLQAFIIKSLKDKFKNGVYIIEGRGDSRNNIPTIHAFSNGGDIPVCKDYQDLIRKYRSKLTIESLVVAMSYNEQVFLANNLAKHGISATVLSPSDFLHACCEDKGFFYFIMQNLIDSSITIPKTRMVNPKTFSPNVLDEFNGEYVVLKPVDGTMGKGVCFIKKSEVAQIIGDLFKEGAEFKLSDGELSLRLNQLYKRMRTGQDKDKYIVIQEMINSDKIDDYNYTARAVFTVLVQDGKMKIEQKAMYCELPLEKPTEELSHAAMLPIGPSGRFVEFPPEKKQQVERQLIQFVEKFSGYLQQPLISLFNSFDHGYLKAIAMHILLDFRSCAYLVGKEKLNTNEVLILDAVVIQMVYQYLLYRDFTTVDFNLFKKYFTSLKQNSEPFSKIISDSIRFYSGESSNPDFYALILSAYKECSNPKSNINVFDQIFSAEAIEKIAQQPKTLAPIIYGM